ncbi:hypothetical protein P3T36_005105 [Kitasatospora sp. MAP12-15]|uniref:hypothetical protein n=1 Tax=unclassified Kitasatospora TaxID=2633591 RepID=UPI002475680E|nr:hypothetical protein [Kitasatospora sp. MAP12-44]MDH6109935.1 hypothetical protein [Kitasatospora sp. MAP12-44]
MATSRSRWPAYFGSRAHLLGSGGGGVGLVVALFAHTGGWGPAVVTALYGAGAVLGLAFPPPPPPLPPGPETETRAESEPEPELDLVAQLHEELAEQHDRVAQAGWPEPDARTARRLVHGVADRISPASAVRLRAVVGSVVPAELDRYERGSSWQRLEPSDAPPGAEFAERVRLVLEKLP